MKPKIYYRLKEKFINIGVAWDRLSPTEADAIKFAHKNINSEPRKRIDVNHFSLEYCLAHSGESINARFRNDEPRDIDLQIADMVAMHGTRVPMVVYRGVCKDVFEQMRKNAESMDGVDLYEKSFLQTSLVKGHETRSQYHLRIYVPKGTQAVYLGNVNDEQHYYEVDIQHGVKLQVVSIDNKYINCMIIP